MSLEHSHDPSEIAARLKSARDSGGDLKDTVFGAIDGAVTTFAIVAGVAGAGLPTGVIVALGVANVLADGFSMAAGNYSGTKAELDYANSVREYEHRQIDREPEGEREELRQILATKGLEGQLLEDATDAIAQHKETWVDMMMIDEYGLSPVDPNPMRAAVVTFIAFIAAGIVPLLPFFIVMQYSFTWSVVLTGVVFFAIGALRSRFSLAPWWRTGIETLLIGGAAAGIAFFVGSLFNV